MEKIFFHPADTYKLKMENLFLYFRNVLIKLALFLFIIGAVFSVRLNSPTYCY
jgi:hypothetical protein